MPADLPIAVEEARSLLLDPARLVKAGAGGRRKGRSPRWKRVAFRPIEVKAGRRLQITEYDERQAHTRNVEWGDPAARAIDELLAEPFGHWHVATTSGDFSFRLTKAGKVMVTRTAQPREQRTEHDRSKARRIDPGEPFLFELGITTDAGRMKAARADKYHQIDEFVRLLDAAVTDGLRGGRLSRRPLTVVDLGCGNAYLTFAAFHHLTNSMSIDATIIGVDVKEQSRRHSEGVAERLGWRDRMSFITSGILEADIARPVDVVMALHACDTATDEALARAIGWGAPLVLAAPCCHHDVQRQLRQQEPPAPYALVTRDGLLRERFGDVLTDSLRAHLLRQAGYRADVVEFVDTRHTPRNTLIRAHLTGATASAEQTADYQELVTSWHLRPKLATLLGNEEGCGIVRLGNELC